MRAFFVLFFCLWAAVCHAEDSQQKLLNLLQSDTPKLQEIGVRRLGAHGMKEGFDPVLKLLRDPDCPKSLKVTIVRALMDIDKERAPEVLIDLIKNSDDMELRLEVIKFSGREQYPEIATMLLKYFGETENEEIKLAILSTLPFFKEDPRVAQVVIQELSSEMSNVLFEKTIQIIKRMQLKETVDPLLALYARTDSQDRKIRVISALGNLENKKVLPMLLELVDDNESPLLQASALEALGNLEEESAVPEIRPFLDDTSPALQIIAIVALGEIGDQGSVPKMIEIYRGHAKAYDALDLDDNSKGNLTRIAANLSARTKIIGVLKDLSPQKSMEVFLDGIKMIEAPTNELTGHQFRRAIGKMQSEAFEGLISTEDPSLNTILIEKVLLQFPALNIRNLAIALLQEGEGPAILERLVYELQNRKTPEIRGSAAFALGGFKDQRVIQPLTEALKDPSELVVKEALLSLSEFPGTLEKSAVVRVRDGSNSEEITEITEIASELIKLQDTPGSARGTTRLQGRFAGRYIDMISAQKAKMKKATPALGITPQNMN